MATDQRAELARIHRFDQLIRYLRDEMGWPIASDDFEELTFDYTPEELGLNAESAAKIQEIKRLRPLSVSQPWGIFFVKFEPKNLPVVALRRILSQVALKKRASANAADRAGWAADDLLFVSNYGQDGERKISFAHFARPSSREDLPTLKVLGWDNQDTPLHLDSIAKELTENLAWPQDENDADAWRKRWRSAFTLGHREVITTAERLSIRLAELAGAIRDRIRSAIAIESPRGPLTRLMKAFQESLIQDLDAEGFADMYAQTISYGLLSSRIADPTKKTADDFAAHMRTSPFLRELMQTFLKAGGRKDKSGGAGIDFDELGVADVVELLDGANMEAVLRDFGDRNRQEDPVIHFFEGFLHAYDRRIRKDRGVFYTPQPVVSYIVRSVHELLQTEFGLADGLADTTTWGEMLRNHPGLKLPPLTDEPNEMRTISPNEPFVQILDPATGTATFLVEVIEVIHKHLEAKWQQQRLTEAQQRAAWNDYVPQHLLPRLHAFELMMAPYAIAHMKIGLKLAETGYRFGTEERARIYLTNALEPWVKQLPLIGFDALAHEAAAVNEIKRHKRFTVVIGNPPYSRSSSNKGPFIEQLMESYKAAVRDERNIQPLSDDYIKFIRLSEHFLHTAGRGIHGMITNNTFLSGRIHRGMRECLLSLFRRGVILNLHGSGNVDFLGAKGVTDENVFDILQGVSVAVLSTSASDGELLYAELIGPRQTKYENLSSSQVTSWQALQPAKPYFLWIPRSSNTGDEYKDFVSLDRLFQFFSVSGKPGDDNLLVSFSRDEVLPKLEDFRRAISSGKFTKLTEAGRNLAARPEKKAFDSNLVCRYAYRPFDTRFTYYDADVWTRAVRPLNACVDGSPILLTTKIVKDPFFSHVFVSRLFADVIFLSNTSSINCYSFPDKCRQDETTLRFGGSSDRNLDLSLFTEKLPTVTHDEAFSYIYAVLHSPIYRERYFESLQYDFPRLPLTGSFELFRALAQLGGQLTALHLLETPKLDKPITEFIGSRSLEVEKISWLRDTVWVDKAQTTGFKGVPEDVWNFHIGGYQVCEKWLKDRKGRTLSNDDIAHYQKIIVALSETICLMGEIDSVIEKYGGWPDAFLTK